MIRYRPLAPLLLCLAPLVVASARAEPPAKEAPAAVDAPEADSEMDRLMAFQKAYQAAHREVAEANLLRQIERYEALGAAFSGSVEDADDILASILSWKWSAVGDPLAAHRAFDAGTPTKARPADEIAAARASLRGFEPIDAVAAIVDAVGDRRAVFVNEAHHVAQHRTLTLRLLPALRAAGFTHFAAETVTEDPDALDRRGYPSRATGTYTDEPLYADIVRTALRLGFTIVPYESPGHPAQREPGQARRLVDGVFEQQPDARVVVHLGYSHNRESSDSFGGVGAMAYHFRELTGIDPLTIDQTLMSERGRPEVEHPLYQDLCGDADTADAVAFRNAEGALWRLPGDDRDITVCLPRSRFESGRATWLRLGGLRQAVELPSTLCGDVEACLVEARPVDEGADAIPIDRVVVRRDEPRPALVLPDGRYRIEARTLDDQPVGKVEVRVGEPPASD